MNLSKVL